MYQTNQLYEKNSAFYSSYAEKRQPSSVVASFNTNGYKNRYISAAEPIPDGWWRGMIRYASEG